jgi:hypothetical protein
MFLFLAVDFAGDIDIHHLCGFCSFAKCFGYVLETIQYLTVKHEGTRLFIPSVLKHRFSSHDTGQPGVVNGKL